MQMDLVSQRCEYERASPHPAIRSRLPYDKRAEKAWWADYWPPESHTADAAGPAAQGAALLTRPYHCVQNLTG